MMEERRHENRVLRAYTNNFRPVCANHTCNAEECTEIQARNRPFCTQHACHGTGCHVQAEPDTSSCADHRCSFSGGCSLAAQHDNDVCEQHECRATSCRRPVGGIDWEHCKSHVCRTDDCTARKTQGSSYCEGCKCADAECGALKNANSEYCAAHSCRSARCNNPPDDDAPFCTDHKCKSAGCPRANVPGESSYCSRHRCRFGRDDGTECSRGRWVVETEERVDAVENGDGDDGDEDDLNDDDTNDEASRHGQGRRGSVIVFKSRFCEKHSCKVFGCTEVRRKGAGYCATHACGWVASNGKVCTREGERWGFCGRHGCSVPDCSETVCAEGYGFCDGHSCQGVVEMEGEAHPVRCQELAPASGHGYCEDHMCGASGCPEPIETVNSTARFCQSHLCSWDRGCERVRAVPKAEGGFFCVVHECERAGCTAGRRPTGEALCAFHWKEDVERIRRGKELATSSAGFPPALPEPAPRYTLPIMSGYGPGAITAVGVGAMPSAAPLPIGASASAWRRGASYDEYEAPPPLLPLALPPAGTGHHHPHALHNMHGGIAHSPHAYEGHPHSPHRNAHALAHSQSRSFGHGHGHGHTHPHSHALAHVPAHDYAYAHPLPSPHAQAYPHGPPPIEWEDDHDDDLGYVWDDSVDVADDEWAPRNNSVGDASSINRRLLLDYAHQRERSDSYTRERPKGYTREREGKRERSGSQSVNHSQDPRERERILHMQATQAAAAQAGGGGGGSEGRHPRRGSEGYAVKQRDVAGASWG